MRLLGACSVLFATTIFSSGVLPCTGGVVGYSGSAPPSSVLEPGLHHRNATWAALPAKIARTDAHWGTVGAYVRLARELGRQEESVSVLHALGQKLPSLALRVAISELGGGGSRDLPVSPPPSSPDHRLRAHLNLRHAANALLEGQSLAAAAAIGQAATIIDARVGATSGLRLELARALALINPAEARRRAWRSWRAYKRRGDELGMGSAAEVLSVISAVAPPHSGRAWLRRALSIYQARLPGAGVYRSVVQSGSEYPRFKLRPSACSALSAWRVRVDCAAEVLTAAWRRGELEAAVEAYGGLPPVPDFSGHPALSARAVGTTLPLLRATSRWADFEDWRRAGLAAARRLGLPDLRSWIALETLKASRAMRRPISGLTGMDAEAGSMDQRVSRLVEKARWYWDQGAPERATEALVEAVQLADEASVRVPLETLLAAYDLKPELFVRGIQQAPWPGTAPLPFTSEEIGGLLVRARLAEVREQLAEADALYRHARQGLREEGPFDVGDRFLREELHRRVDERLAAVALAREEPLEALNVLERGRARPRPNQKGLAWSHVISHLQESDLVVFLARVDANLWAWGIESSGARPILLKEGAGGIERRLEVWSTMMQPSASEGDAWGEIAKPLAGDLFGSMIEAGWLEGKTRLFVVPPVGLREVPFDVLLGAVPEIARASREGVLFAGSLTELEFAWHQRVPAGELVVFVPGGGLSALIEGRSIADALGASLFLGATATKRSFIERSPGARVIHFGGHSEAPNLLMGSGGLSFRSSVASVETLRFAEISQLALAGSSVILMGCDTVGTMPGSRMLGSSVVTLGDAFLAAGSRNVIGSLWEIDDTSAREISLLFYRWGGTDRGPFALMQAKRALKERYPDQPGRWAGFVWQGAPPAP